MSEPTILGLSPEFYFQRDVERRLEMIEKKLEEIIEALNKEQQDKKRPD